MPFTEMAVMVAIVSALALGFIHVVRLIGTMILHRTIRRAIDRDPDKADSLLDRLGAPSPASGDDRLSTVLIAFGVAMIAASLVIGDPNWLHYGIAAALFPLIIGAALWLRLFVLQRAGRRGSGQ